MKRKGKLVAVGLLLCVTVIGGTWAYFNQTLTVTNEFDTGTYDTELVEEFKPSEGENWEPGSEVNKDVTVKNSGTLPVVVRVKFEEKWERGGKEIYKFDTVLDKDEIDIVDPFENGRAQNKFENVYQSSPSTEEEAGVPYDENLDEFIPDGRFGTDVDDSVVHKTLILGNSATDSPCWVYNSNDGYYYWTGVLAGAVENSDGTTTYAETALLLDSVTLCENVDMGLYEEIKYYSTNSNATSSNADDWAEFETDGSGNYLSTSEMSKWLKDTYGDIIYFMKSATKVDSLLKGYSDAEYTLTITAQTVQATTNAVEAAFGSDVLDYWGDNLTSDDTN